MQARASPNSVSAIASTTRVFPDPVGPRKSRVPTAGPGGPNKQQVAYRAPGRIQPRQKHLVDLSDLLDRLVLPDNLPVQGSLKIARIIAAPGRVEHGSQIASHRVGPLFP